MRDLGVWLEAEQGCKLPPDFFAAVRICEAGACAPPTRCAPSEASCLGRYPCDGSPAVVDIFQRVGTISLGQLQQGASADAAVDWPGLSTLHLRVVVGVDYADAHKEEDSEPMTPVPSALPSLPEEALQDTAVEKAESFMAAMSPLTPANQGLSPKPELRTKPSRLPSAEEDGRKFYKPVSLNNCDQIIPNLYLGGVAAVADHQGLVKQGIRAVCCCCRELEMPSSEFCPEIEYFRVDVEDISREPIELYFPEATEFIHSWLSREQPVLVHCRAGVSRSASIVIAYLITYHNYSLHDAFFLVRSHRSVVTPNIGFMEKLGEYEEEKRGTEPTIEINKYMGWYTTPERAAVPDLKPD
mmetsp:Transcript_46585/g.120603  ORF Transcript_46585/g.120603 Transcript_46585/m.120603 type:complete len:356 (+) Transcript_46585:194-1261(+)